MNTTDNTDLNQIIEERAMIVKKLNRLIEAQRGAQSYNTLCIISDDNKSLFNCTNKIISLKDGYTERLQTINDLLINTTDWTGTTHKSYQLMEQYYK